MSSSEIVLAKVSSVLRSLFGNCTRLTRFLLFLGAFGNVKVGWFRGKAKDKYAIKTMKKAEIINSKHVDHIENEKNILERVIHPFAVSEKQS
jgi:serine/threonine protein kinase